MITDISGCEAWLPSRGGDHRTARKINIDKKLNNCLSQQYRKLGLAQKYQVGIIEKRKDFALLTFRKL